MEAAARHQDTRADDEALLTAPWERRSQAAVFRPFWA